MSSFNIQDYKMFSKPKLHTKKVSGKEKYELCFYSRVRIFHLWWSVSNVNRILFSCFILKSHINNFIYLVNSFLTIFSFIYTH